MKTAVVLFNLGGPDTSDAIAPFLYNLFSDKRIIGLPAPLRHMVAKLISTSRAPKVKPLYAEMGGASPILPNTQAQADALECELRVAGGEWKVFICMRYWHPRAAEVVKQVKAYAPDKIILLPLYPQFSTTTTESSFVEWEKAAKKAGLKTPTERVCCYPIQAGFIDAMADLINRHISASPHLRILFSAHGLPQKIIDKKGDPYVEQVQMTAAAIVEKLMSEPSPLEGEGRVRGTSLREGDPSPDPSLKGRGDFMNLDWKVTYQSRVGPEEWVKPYTDVEIRSAGAAGKDLVLVPIAFVSEHIETLVELDVENKKLALESGCKSYTRIPTVSVHPEYIKGLAELVRKPTMPNHCAKNNFACPCKK